MYFVYVLISKRDNKYYTGITNNIKRRLDQHNKGNSATRSTLNRGPFELVFAQDCLNRDNARKMEKYLKSGSGREIRNELIV